MLIYNVPDEFITAAVASSSSSSTNGDSNNTITYSTKIL